MMSGTNCKNCKADLSGRHGRTRYCDQRCYELWRSATNRRTPTYKRCALCDEEYVIGGKGMTSSVYCSKQCYYTSGIIRIYGERREVYKIWSSATACEICKSEFKSTRDKHIDHCHTTNKLRGILCNGCNVGLGSFKDNSQSIKNSLVYLEKHRVD